MHLALSLWFFHLPVTIILSSGKDQTSWTYRMSQEKFRTYSHPVLDPVLCIYFSDSPIVHFRSVFAVTYISSSLLSLRCVTSCSSFQRPETYSSNQYPRLSSFLERHTILIQHQDERSLTSSPWFLDLTGQPPEAFFIHAIEMSAPLFASLLWRYVEALFVRCSNLVQTTKGMDYIHIECLLTNKSARYTIKPSPWRKGYHLFTNILLASNSSSLLAIT